MRKKLIEHYKKSADYIREELKTDRHISACMGSAGFIYTKDVNDFYRWCNENGYKDISKYMFN